ncbi:DUF721 domain-containing protein [Candidatus Azambacteria bacterium]|nr:DUF721 domain-containing protein [Candidatus Azambacteria bacterium]
MAFERLSKAPAGRWGIGGVLEALEVLRVSERLLLGIQRGLKNSVRPERFSRGILTVSASHPAYLAELKLREAAFLQALNDRLRGRSQVKRVLYRLVAFATRRGPVPPS